MKKLSQLERVGEVMNEGYSCSLLFSFVVFGLTMMYLLILSLLHPSLSLMITILFIFLSLAILLLLIHIKLTHSLTQKSPLPNTFIHKFQKLHNDKHIHYFISLFLTLSFLFLSCHDIQQSVLSLLFSFFASAFLLNFNQFTYIFVLALLVILKANIEMNLQLVFSLLQVGFMCVLILIKDKINSQTIRHLKNRLLNQDTYFAGTVHELRNPLSS